ncbi:VID27-domain-containing protein [Piedraia hortae CBS 480.64]|uniref:VID27-domain-containing protein n=1 Tax=Piedraia hortae CBS 480.64 TaxID=1314780 RepID=A0A6A7BT96_9PEZI|nr:VID27-domain-containing protein [Piedraia hortae CBS 480.64]
MFALKSLSNYLFGNANKVNIVELPAGTLYLVRPHSIKGSSELLYKDAAAYIRRTGQEFQYQLVIQRAYEEGEEELLEEAEDEAEGRSEDERTFLLDKELRFRAEVREDGEAVLAWLDLSGDEGDVFEFICDKATTHAASVSNFGLIAAQCQYERQYRRPHTQASPAELAQFSFDDEPVPEASPVAIDVESSPASIRTPSRQADMVRSRQPARQSLTLAKISTPTKLPVSRKAPSQDGEVLSDEPAELHLFDFNTGTFVLQDACVQATVSDLGKWRYWLHITGDKEWLGQDVVPDINPVFNFEYTSFIFNHYDEDGSAYSWLLKFENRESEERFQEGLMRALWEHLNETRWKTAVKSDQDYVLDAFNDLTVDQADDEREREAAEEDEEYDEEYEEYDEEPYQHQAEDYDEDEDEDEVRTGLEANGEVNSQLAVGTKGDRSFVVRGDKIGVFKHTDDNRLEFATSINKIATPKGKSFSPQKVMLRAADRDMVLQNESDPHSLYRMDMEYGKVVDEWKVHDDIPVNIFAPESKFAQGTDEQTFLGLSKNALFRIDPRLAGQKLVDTQLKQYASKNEFSAAATTDKGYIAVASSKGDIRLFDRLGINAKTALPALGDPIIGIDVSADGRWVLATTRTYLLLVDALQHEGKHEGKLGFERAFGKDSKPQPRRLALAPSHVAQFQHETGQPLAFTPARFNTGEGHEETTVISSTGPFVVTWSMRKVLANRKDPYHIKRYAEKVMADNFRFGSDKNIIVALPNEVDMVARRALQRPTRESIMATPRKARREVVNSPY